MYGVVILQLREVIHNLKFEGTYGSLGHHLLEASPPNFQEEVRTHHPAT
jgi:hypothetical protein